MNDDIRKLMMFTGVQLFRRMTGSKLTLVYSRRTYVDAVAWIEANYEGWEIGILTEET